MSQATLTSLSPRRGNNNNNNNSGGSAGSSMAHVLGVTSHGSGSGGGGGSSPHPPIPPTVNKASALEEYLNSFPVDRPETAGTLRGQLEGDQAMRKRDNTGGGKLDYDLRRYEREQTQKRAGREAVKAKLGTNIRRQRIETWVQLSEKNNAKLRKENETLEMMATLTQENCIDNDQRFEEAVTSLRAELEFATVFRQDNSETLDYIKTAIGAIQDRVSQMRVAAEHQSQLEFENIREAFERQLEQQARELEEVRENGKSTTGEWKAQNETAQAQLEGILLRTDATYHRFKELSDRNRQLRVEHSAQEGDTTLLEQQFRLVSTHHQRLKDRLYDLEVELRASTTNPSRHSQQQQQQQQQGMSSEGELLAAIDDVQRGLTGSGGKVEPSDVDAKQREYKRSLARAQELLEQEATNLKAVRHAHILALRQRTELEVFLRQAIVNHRRNKEAERQTLAGASHDSSGMAFITNRPPFNTAGTQQQQQQRRLHTTTFTAEDRREVVDALLSSQRVLELLYADPNEAEAMQRAADSRRAFLSGDRKTLEADVEQLWAKWKEWSSAAASAFAASANGGPNSGKESEAGA